MQIIFTDKNGILYTQEKSEILENIKCYKNTEVAELFLACSRFSLIVRASEKLERARAYRAWNRLNYFV